MDNEKGSEERKAPEAEATEATRGGNRRRRRRGGAGRLLRLGLIALLVVVIGIIGLVAAAGAWIKGYLRGDGFRELVSIKTSDSFRADGEFEEISWTGSSVYSDGFTAVGRPDGTFSKIDIESIRAETNVGELIGFGNLFRFWELSDKSIEVPQVRVGRLTLQARERRGEVEMPAMASETPDVPDELPPAGEEQPSFMTGSTTPTPAPPAATESQPDPAASSDAGEVLVADDEPASMPEKKGFFESLAPTGFRLDTVEIAETNVFVERHGEEKLAIKGVETKMRPLEGSDNKAWDVTGRGGTLLAPHMPEFEIESITGRLREREVFITDAVLEFFDEARLIGSGEMHFGDEPGMDLKVKVSDVNVDNIVTPDWKQRVSGMLSGDVHITGRPGDPEALKKKGALEVTGGVLEAVPILDKVADYARAERFRRLVLTTATADYESQGETTQFTNVNVESEGLARITGDVLLEGDQLVGTIRLGITPGTLQWIPGAEQKVFSTPEGGYLWTDVMITGTLENPKEDLSSRMMSAAAEAVAGALVGETENAAEAMKEVGASLTEEISKKTGKDPKEIEEAAEQIWDSIRKSLLGQ